MLKENKNQIYLTTFPYPKAKGQRFGYSETGFAAFYLTILILVVVFAISVSISILTYGEQKISRNIVKSSQAYFAAEAGIEDALIRLKNKLNLSSPYSFGVGDGTTTVEISDVIGGSRTIISTGNSLNRIRKIEVGYAISAQGISFYYGAQVGDGGIEIQDSAKIDGNVFSNGSIINLDGNPEITGTAKVAKTGNKISRMIIGQDAYVDTCENSQIAGKLTFSVNNNCTASQYANLAEEIATTSLPITEEQIQKWKDEAFSGGVSGSLILSGQQTVYLGPKKIEGNLTVQNQGQLIVTGTLWVTGTIIIQDKGKITLDPATYGSLSGVVISDSKITVQDSAKALGTGQAGSYLMLLSTLDSILTGDVAMVIQNSPELDIIYASRGRIQLQDSIKLREVSSWGLKLQNQATVIYETGLADLFFTSGPAGSWEVVSWREIE